MGLKHTKHVAFEMITIGIKNNISDTIKLLDNQHRKQVPFARSWAKQQYKTR
jgi:hypothetical protein